MNSLALPLLTSLLLPAAMRGNPFGSFGLGNRVNLIPNRIGLNQRQKRKNTRRAIAAGFKP